ncbi:endonuclease [Myroides sp. M-43]|uniref:endonuclease I family protein n=1 Tax=Myroides oncorhynchi TaxID=2893756 RepID=UPI001E416C94|nr:endonuclease [Myroides oncorhynchi]MCC9043113.1 endonuclease [Myroides oncorhynchi]
MKILLVTIASFLLSFSGCSKDPIITEATPGKEKPTIPTKPEDGHNEKPDPGTPGDYIIPANQKEYYAVVDFSKQGKELKDQLTRLLEDTHTKNLKYTPEVWEATKATDYVPITSGKPTEVYLLYGHDNKGNSADKQAYTRAMSKQNQGGAATDTWNREHVYTQNAGNFKTKPEGIGTDIHNLRSSDTGWNGLRSNLKFIAGSGYSGKVGEGWYPGNEWKGDVARMMMYMYVRYGQQCLPSKNAIGSTANTPDGMIDLLLQWNAEDPVSEIEKRRNEYHGNTNNPYAQGNRNPFIDNPYLATQIWGGKPAHNLWVK